MSTAGGPTCTGTEHAIPVPRILFRGDWSDLLKGDARSTLKNKIEKWRAEGKQIHNEYCVDSGMSEITKAHTSNLAAGVHLYCRNINGTKVTKWFDCGLLLVWGYQNNWRDKQRVA